MRWRSRVLEESMVVSWGTGAVVRIDEKGNLSFPKGRRRGRDWKDQGREAGYLGDQDLIALKDMKWVFRGTRPVATRRDEGESRKKGPPGSDVGLAREKGSERRRQAEGVAS